MLEPYSVYIHIPFCQQRCFYCDFNTLADMDGKIEDYIKALKQEIDVLTRHFKHQIPVHSVYIGGGTPSYIHPMYITELMDWINQRFAILMDSEISIEANPGTLSEEKLQTYLNAGINRISLGVQSTDDCMLKKLGRIHNFEEVEKNITLARECGFRNISADLIFGLPDQSLSDWQESLERMVRFSLEHLSLYSLTIEEGTPFGACFNEGKLIVPDEDTIADQYTHAINWLAGHGYEQYEISNWRKMDADYDFRSKHNCQYWLNKPYIGFGLGAHSCFEKQRIANTTALSKYIQVNRDGRHGIIKEMPASVSVDKLQTMDEMKETMMLGLRLVKDGVSKEAFFDRYQQHMEDVFAGDIKELLHHELVQWIENRLVLTNRGILLGNQVFMHFV